MRNKWIAPLAIAAMLGIGIALYNRLPERVPSHWNWRGEVDGTFGPLQAVVIPPTIALGTWTLVWIAPRIDPKRASYAAFRDTLDRFINAIILLLALLHIATLLFAISWNVPIPRLLLLGMGLLFALIGNELGRVRPNWFVGIRTPWTLADPKVWRQTHRLGGRALLVSGLIVALVALVLPPPLAGSIALAIMLGVAGWLIVYSYLLWRRSVI